MDNLISETATSETRSTGIIYVRKLATHWENTLNKSREWTFHRWCAVSSVHLWWIENRRNAGCGEMSAITGAESDFVVGKRDGQSVWGGGGQWDVSMPLLGMPCCMRTSGCGVHSRTEWCNLTPQRLTNQHFSIGSVAIWVYFVGNRFGRRIEINGYLLTFCLV
jgi:hypothetical protein